MDWNRPPELCPAGCLVTDGDNCGIPLGCCLMPGHAPPHWDQEHQLWWAEPEVPT